MQMNLSRLKKKVSGNKEHGFTLLEVMIAVALLGIVALIIEVGMGASFKADNVARQQNVALTLAQSQLEYVNSLSYDTGTAAPHPQYAVIALPSQYQNDYTITCAATLDPMSTGAGDLQKISVTVYYKGTRVLTLETYKVNG
jgi:prepilin-type N-terminal cleavage/methylation domain-containing protein